MKKIHILSIILLLSGAFQFTSAQTYDCSGGRFFDSLYVVTVAQDVVYGNNNLYDGTPTDLTMDIYTPVGDPLAKRPLIIFAPKGSFLQVDKQEEVMVKLCTRFASYGYTAAAINYRVGVDFTAVLSDPDGQFTYAVMRAVHDYRAAVRFFRKDAVTTNLYKIDTNYIIAGGSSAGAITALHLAYLDEVAEIPTTVIDTTGLGGLEGLSGNPGYSSDVRYVVNLCGAIADTTWIKNGDQPLISMHGNLDTEVPYGTATISIVIPIMEVDGSASVAQRASHMSLENPFYTFWGRTHIPYDPNAGGNYGDYLDTVSMYVKSYLRDWICGYTGIAEDPATESLDVWPNPASGQLNMTLGVVSGDFELSLSDLCGKALICKSLSFEEGEVEVLNTGDLAAGIYLLQLKGDKGRYVKRIVIR
jgi:hypothetical protein